MFKTTFNLMIRPVKLLTVLGFKRTWCLLQSCFCKQVNKIMLYLALFIYWPTCYRASHFVWEMVRLIHKLLLQFYFGGQTPMSYAASIFLFNLIEAILEIILYYIFVYCGLL